MITSSILKESKKAIYIKVVKTSLESKTVNDINIIYTLIPDFNYTNHKGELIIPSSGIK